jgi:hypothetical protein
MYDPWGGCGPLCKWIHNVAPFFACIKKENVCGGSIGKTIHEQEQDRRQQDMKPMKPTLVWEELGKGKSTLTEQILQRTHPKKRMLGIHTEVAT